MIKIIQNSINNHKDVISQIESELVPQINEAAIIIASALKKGNKLIFFGNGGSASDAQHISAEFIGRFVKERNPLPSIALNTDTSAITAISNDYGYDQVFSRQIKGLANPGDVIVGITTSGNSQNVINALALAKDLNLYSIGLLGKDGGDAKKHCNIPIIINSNITARIQEGHILIGHIICACIDEQF